LCCSSACLFLLTSASTRALRSVISPPRQLCLLEASCWEAETAHSSSCKSGQRDSDRQTHTGQNNHCSGLHADHQTAGPDFCVCRHTDEAAKGLHQSCNQAWPRHATLGGRVLLAAHEAAQYVRQAMLQEYSWTHPKRQLQKERCAASVFRMVFGRAERSDLWQLT